MKKSEIFYDISKQELWELERTHYDMDCMSRYFYKAKGYFIVAATGNIDAYLVVKSYHERRYRFDVKIPIIYGVQFNVFHRESGMYKQICLAKNQKGLENIYRLVSQYNQILEYDELMAKSEGLIFLMDSSINRYYIEKYGENDIVKQQRIVFNGDEKFDLEFDQEIEKIISEIDYHKIRLFPRRQEIDNIIQYEQFIIDFCTERFEAIVNEEYERRKELGIQGGYDISEAEKMLRYELERMVRDDKAVDLMIVKCIAEIVKKKKFTLKSSIDFKRSLMVKLLGMTDESNLDIVKYLNSEIFKEELKYISMPYYYGLNLSVGVSEIIYEDVLKGVIDIFSDYKFVKLDEYFPDYEFTTGNEKEEEVYFMILPKDCCIPVKPNKYVVGDVQMDISYYRLEEVVGCVNIIKLMICDYC